MSKLDVSVVVPVLNEEDNVEELYRRTAVALDKQVHSWEMIYVDDGSQDATFARLEKMHHQDGRVKVVSFRRNQGKAAAYTAGFLCADGEIIITMDGDLQDDPAEIPKFLAAMDEGYDVVSGWKYRGKGEASSQLGRGLPSRMFNIIVARMSGLYLNDFNCPFKAYRHYVLKDLHIYGELHRFIPVLLHNKGYRIKQIKVENYPRQHGISKYGFERFMRGYLDLATVLFLTRYTESPLYFYGYGGSLLFLTGFFIDLFLTVRGLFFTGVIGHTALLIFGVLLMVLGIQLFAIGFIADLIISRDRRNIDSYPIRTILAQSRSDKR